MGKLEMKLDCVSHDWEVAKKEAFGLRYIIHRLCEEHQFDIVILDLPPGVSRSTEMLIQTTDVILPVVEPDYNGYGAYSHLLKEGIVLHCPQEFRSMPPPWHLKALFLQPSS